MKRVLIVCFLLILLASCDSTKKPEGLLSEDKMVEVLIDIHVTEGIASSLPVPYDSSQVLYRLLEKDVFINNEVEDSVFHKSLIYYMADPTKINTIYSRVVDSLQIRGSEGGIEERM